MEKVFFRSGELVTVKHNLPTKPIMVVKRVIKERLGNTEEANLFLGIRCFWFSENGVYYEQTFNSKDLEKVSVN